MTFFLLLLPPLLWLGVVYLGSLAALLLQSFYSIDEMSGLVKQEFTLKTYAELLRPSALRRVQVGRCSRLESAPAHLREDAQLLKRLDRSIAQVLRGDQRTLEVPAQRL